MENLAIDPVFSNWVSFIKKVLIKNLYRNLRILRSPIFSSKVEIFSITKVKKKSVFFSVCLPSLTVFQLSFVHVCVPEVFNS